MRRKDMANALVMRNGTPARKILQRDEQGSDSLVVVSDGRCIEDRHNLSSCWNWGRGVLGSSPVLQMTFDVDTLGKLRKKSLKTLSRVSGARPVRCSAVTPSQFCKSNRGYPPQFQHADKLCLSSIPVLSHPGDREALWMFQNDGFGSSCIIFSITVRHLTDQGLSDTYPFDDHSAANTPPH